MFFSYRWSLIIILNVFALLFVNRVLSFPNDRQNDLNCPSVTFCHCSIGTFFEVTCPNRINTSITIRVEPQQQTNRVEIECNSDDSDIFNRLPKWSIGASDVVKFNGCSLASETSSVQRIFDQLGIRNVQNLIFFAKTNAARTVNGVEMLSPRLFDNVTNVRSLDLRANFWRLPSQILYNFHELEFLQISSTNLNNSMIGMFRHLNNLKRLNLWSNHLGNLTKESFVGLLRVVDVEISSNDIVALTSDAFNHLIMMESINFNNNRLDTFPSQLFDGNKILQKIRIINNHLQSNTLPNEFLAHLLVLEAVWINDCNLTSLPEDLFTESYNLRNVSLAHNKLREIPARLFYDQTSLLSLDLSNNQLHSLDDSTFQDTTTLSILHLSYNSFNNISRHLISGLNDLHELYMDNNNLHTIHMDAFKGTSLRVLHLQNNQLNFENPPIVVKRVSKQRHISIFDEMETNMEKSSPFQQLDELQILILRNNSMKIFLDDWYYKNVALNELDLSYNQIEMLNFGHIFHTWSDEITINVSNNRITEMMAANSAVFDNTESPVTWILNHNPLKCDCTVMHFAIYLRNQQQNLSNVNTKFITDQLKCALPERFESQQLQNVPLSELTCPLDKENTTTILCPQRCSCYVRTIERAAVFNCSNANLNEIPTLPNIEGLMGLQFYELHIENNNISSFPLANTTTGYRSVSRIFAKNNSLEEILPEHLPNNLFTLDVSGNQLKQIKMAVLNKLTHMENLQNVSFGQNPWICDCAAYDLMKFMEIHAIKMVGIDNTACDNGILITHINSHNLCPIELTKILIIISISCAVIAVMVALVFVLTTLYYKNRQQIMVWMFAHHKFNWFFNIKPKADDHKTYDVFVLYSTCDEEFIMDKLIPQLKNGPNPLKVCTLSQEVKAGQIIPDQIARLVESSRRTVVFLTPNFIEYFQNKLNKKTVYKTTSGHDIWGLMGFRLAHENALNEKQTRVIVITKGDIGSYNDFQHELKAYLKTNIFFQWGEKQFFDKLRLAIAHPTYFIADKPTAQFYLV